MATGTFVVDLIIRNDALRCQIERILLRSGQFTLSLESHAGSSDLLILELSSNLDEDFKLAQAVLHSGDAREVFLASGNPDHDILMRAIRAGAREFFGPGVTDEEIQAALDRFIERQKSGRPPEPISQGRIIAVFGSKGGVGTTTVAVNLAVSLARRSSIKSVALLDMNLFGDIPLFMEIEPTFTWREIIKNISRLDATFLRTILAKDPSGVFVLPSPGYLDSQNMATPEITEHLLQVMGQMFDVIVVDMGQHLDDSALKILRMTDLLLLVTVQSLPCLANANKILRSFQDLGLPPQENIKLLINRYLKSATIDVEEVESSLDSKVYWKIPNDYATTISAINKGVPLSSFAPKQPITQSFQDLAALLAADPGEGGKKKKKWWIF